VTFRSVLVSFVLAAAAACTSSHPATQGTSPATDASVDPFGGVVSPGPDAAAAADPPPAPAAAATPAPAATSILKKVALTDIVGLAGTTAITQLAQLGVVEPASGAFHPHAPLTRATFVRWLVKANNAEFISESHMIRPAVTADGPIFVDVPVSSPDYKYIQGMADAGYVVGIDAKHFAPERNITREELIAIYVNREVNGKTTVTTSLADMGSTLTDAASVSKPYWGAFHDDTYGFYKGNIARIFGDARTLHPQRLATREEAAIAVSVVQNADAASTVTAAAPH
jgi:predicted flap endonuclease-1-like 5' DNA nuclease